MASSMKIGAAWWGQDRNGADYVSITLDPVCGLVIQPGQKMALFANPNKIEQRHPDFDVVLLATRQADTEADEFSPQQAPRNTYAQPARQAAPPPEAYEAAPPPRAMAPRAAAPAPRQPAPGASGSFQAPAPGGQRPPAARPPQQRRPANPPDYDEELSDPFAE